MSSIEIFCCYAHNDAPLLESLKAHLSLLQRQGLISLWSDTNISPGSEWEKEVQKHLNTAHIILLLVSSDFMASDYCYSKEMMQAIARHDRGEARVIPIILRPVFWQGAPFGKLQALPTGAKPVISPSWHSQDEALLDVVKGIGEAIKSLQNIPSMYYSRFIGYASQEVRNGRPISEVLTEFDPSLAALFNAIVAAANSRISDVIRMGKPLRTALSEYYPGLEYLFDVALSLVTGDNSLADLQERVIKLADEVTPVGDGDLRVQAEVTPDAFGLIADRINYLVEELASLVMGVEIVTTSGIESANSTLEAIQARRKEIETIYKMVSEKNTNLSENDCAFIRDQTIQIDRFLVHTDTETRRMSRLMDRLYAAVSNFRLPQYITDDNNVDNPHQMSNPKEIK